MNENLVKARESKTRQESLDIEKEFVEIYNEILHFERISLFRDALLIKIPKEYEDMPQNYAEIKYPMTTRPQIIKTSQDTTINICFSLHNEKFLASDVEETTQGFMEIIRRIHPTASFFMQAILPNKIKIGMFDFKVPAIDCDAYHIYAFASIKSKLLHFAFNAPAAKREMWNPIIIQVLNSIQEGL